MELWHSAGYSFADQAAKAALKHDFGFLANTVEGIAKATQSQMDLLFMFHKFLLALSEEEWKLKKKGAGEAAALACEQVEDTVSHQKFLA